MVKINGTAVNGLTAAYNGSTLTLTGRNIGMSLTGLADLLSGDPVIEVVKNGIVTGIYQSLQLKALTMETIGGVLTVTAMMAAKPIESTGGDGDSSDLVDQIKEVRELAQTAVDAVTAIEEGMSHV